MPVILQPVAVTLFDCAGHGQKRLEFASDADRAGTGTREVRRERSLYRSVRFSPDGTRILYSVALRASLGGIVSADISFMPHLTGTVTQPGISSSISLQACASPVQSTNGTP